MQSSLSPHCLQEDDDYGQRVSGYVQEMPHSQTTDQSMEPQGRDRHITSNV